MIWKIVQNLNVGTEIWLLNEFLGLPYSVISHGILIYSPDINLKIGEWSWWDTSNEFSHVWFRCHKRNKVRNSTNSI